MVVAASNAWAGTVQPIESIGNEVYRITVLAPHKFTRDTQKLKEEALEAAKKFCAKDGKVLKVVSIKEDKSMYLVGSLAQTSVTFKELAPGDPELTAPGEAPARPAVAASPATEQLYADILRLDELRKKGLLSDAEFEVEKKKILERSK